MELDGAKLPDGSRLEADVAIVGGGPAGIVTALELAEAGLDVLLVESGGPRLDQDTQHLGEREPAGDGLHLPEASSARRQLGGNTVTWGGRCVPFDPVDFDARDLTGSARWPIGYADLLPHFDQACRYLDCGLGGFDAQGVPGLAGKTVVPGLPDGDVRTSSLERWSLPTNFGRHYGDRLRRSPRIRVLLRQTCTRVVLDDRGQAVAELETKALDGRGATIAARRYVLSAGGLESTRLLMVSGIGDHSGHLGRWYMAHPQGTIAGARFSTPPGDTVYAHERDPDGVYVRRRFGFSREFTRRHDLPSFAAWLVNPALADPRHRSGMLSLVYLALASPAWPLFASQSLREDHVAEAGTAALLPHVRNLARDPAGAMRFATGFGYRRYLRRGRRVPGFSTYSPDNRYPLEYQSEHLPHRESHVTLGSGTDRLGVPRLRTHLHYGQADVDGVLDAHRRIDRYLRDHGVGRLEYDSADPEARVREQLFAGCHQAGTTRMSERPEDGVVDTDLAVHGVGNLHVASSSVFVTSSHANPTFMILVLALRLAGHLRGQLCSRV
ncbi:MAG TPA: GMC family oxidoreductase [Thermoleophilaceae bacterium]|nr:GMC family oxidoreductase [Thermoleophilaceae bacterium]